MQVKVKVAAFAVAMVPALGIGASQASASTPAQMPTAGKTVTSTVAAGDLSAQASQYSFKCAKPKKAYLNVNVRNHVSAVNYARIYFNNHCKEDRYIKIYWQSAISLKHVGTDCISVNGKTKGNKKKYWRWSRVYKVTSPGICGPQT